MPSVHVREKVQPKCLQYMLEKRYSLNDLRKDFMIRQTENKRPALPLKVTRVADSQSNALAIEAARPCCC
jgi:hypothetical protein